MRKKKLHTGKTLSCETEIKVRFGETDAMGIVWHGSYAGYLEDGREDFGKKYDLTYMGIYKKYGYTIPLVNININYKNRLFYEDECILKTTFKDTPAAKIVFEYELRRKSDNKIIITAETVQVFFKNEELELITPEFFLKWKKENLK